MNSLTAFLFPRHILSLPRIECNSTKGGLHMKQTSCLAQALPYLPQGLRSGIQQLPQHKQDAIQEIRIRMGRPVTLTIRNTEEPLPTAAPITVNAALMESVFKSICEHSVHSYQQEIRRGFITIAGGNRVGISATAVIQQQQQIETLRNISGMNFRIASQIIGCGEELHHRTLAQAAGGLLICAPPNGGKTTILRDLCRICGNDSRVSVIDERGEIAAMKQGVSPFVLGNQTDVFDGYPKAYGIETAVRVMSPQYLVCDEIGGGEETEAILHMLHTGVHLIATAHLGDLKELSQRPQLQRLIDAGAFRYIALLGTGTSCGQICGLRRIGQAI